MGQGRGDPAPTGVAAKSRICAAAQVRRTAYHRAYYKAHKEARRASTRASKRRVRERQAIIRIVCEAVTEARNDKPPFGGLTRAGGWPYSRDAYRSDAKIDRGNGSVNRPLLMLGNSGRETNAQGTLNPHRGSQPVDALRKRRGANGS